MFAGAAKVQPLLVNAVRLKVFWVRVLCEDFQEQLNLLSVLARLCSPLGPEFVAIKVVEDFEANPQTRAEAVFMIAEIALVLGRIDWAQVLAPVDHTQGLQSVAETLARLDALLVRLDQAPADLMSYSHRAIQESRACLHF